MDYEIHLEQHPGRPLAVVHRRAAIPDLPKVIPAACGVVWAVVSSQQIAGAGRHVALYLDDEINLEVGVELAAPFGGSGEVYDSAVPGGLVVATTHYGPYHLLGDAHEAIRRWCEAHGHRTAGPCWEVYGHWRDAWNADPSGITTDVCYLLATGDSPVGR